jgi:hypothetical protein
MDICRYIGELLYRHDCVIVPGLGGFVSNTASARIHPVLHTFSPPRKAILFNVRLQTNDGMLAQYIAGREHITYQEALKHIRGFVELIRKRIEEKRNAEIVKVGVLYADQEGNLLFEPARETNYLLASFGLTEFVSPAILRETYMLKKGNRTAQRKVVRRDRRVPVPLKTAFWVGIPLLALVLSGVFGFSTIRHWYVEYSEILPNVFILHKDSSDGAAESKFSVPANTEETSAHTWLSPVHSGNTIKEIRVAACPETLPSQITELPAEQAHRFFIIGNCFMVEENAMQYTHTLKKKGYTHAGYFLPAGKKLYRAFFISFAVRQEAEEQLAIIRRDETPEAWLFEL